MGSVDIPLRTKDFIIIPVNFYAAKYNFLFAVEIEFIQ